MCSAQPTPQEAREALLADAERIAGMGSWVWDVRTGHQEWSENLFRLLGFEPGEVVPSNDVFFGVVHPDDRERVGEEMARSVSDESAPPYPVEYRAVLASGEVRTLVARPVAVKDTEGQLLRMVGTITDATEAIRQRAEREREREVLELSQQIAAVGSWVWDPVTNTTGGSKELLRIFGTDLLLDLSAFLEWVHPEDQHLVEAAGQQAFLEGRSGPIRVRITRPDGEMRFIEMCSLVPGDPSTSPHYGTVRDVTERVHLERELNLSRTLEATGRLAAGIAHDFNNLLMVVLNNTLEVATERPDPRLDHVVAAAESGADLVRRLLAFGREGHAARVVLDLSDAVREIADWLSRLVGDDVKVVLELCDTPLPVQADPSQLHQVLLNLAANARDAMPTGGTITMHTERSPSGARIRVRDDGVGMSAESQRRAFDPFYTTKEVGDGTGLGLSMAYGVVARMGGSLSLTSEESRGTTVIIELPLADGHPSSSDVEAPEEPAPAPTQTTVLLVEDEPAVRKVAVRMLERRGFAVVAAEGPAEVEEHLASLRPDIVLTDLAMPDGGGQRVAQSLALRHPDVPVVFMTGYAPDIDTLPGRVLHKPFRPAELYDALDEALA